MNAFHRFVCFGLTTFLLTNPFATEGYLVQAAPLANVNFSVNSTADSRDIFPGNGVCETAAGNGVCTLRAAIQETNSLTGPDSITLPSGLYTLTVAGANEDLSATGDLDIRGSLTIIAANSDTTVIDGGGIDRVLHLSDTSAQVTISDVTIRNGNVGLDYGGGIRINSTNTMYIVNSKIVGSNGERGGGIFTQGTLNISNSIISGNHAGYAGSGIFNVNGNVQIDHSIIENNHLNQTIHDGAITSWYSGVLKISQSQIINNTGPGIYTSSSEFTINNDSLVSGNKGFGIFSDAPAASIIHTEISNNEGLGVGNTGTMNIKYSTIKNNSDSSSLGYAGLYNYSFGTLLLTHSAIIGNDGGVAFGGAVTAHSNCLTNNSFGNLVGDYADASDNYWGSSDGPRRWIHYPVWDEVNQYWVEHWEIIGSGDWINQDPPYMVPTTVFIPFLSSPPFPNCEPPHFVSSNIISGDAGVEGAILHYTDGTSKTATANKMGDYSFIVSYGWSGTVTPSKIGYNFSPEFREYDNVTADLPNQNFIARVIPTAGRIFSPIAANDGWVLETNETSNRGGIKNQSGFLRVGDDSKNRQYRSLLYFDTSSLPNSTIIAKVTLKIKQAGIAGENPFITHGDLLADMAKGFFGKSALESADFQAKGVPKPNVGRLTPVDGEPDWYQLVLSPANFKYINLGGVTQFRLRFMKDDDNDKKADFISFFSGDDATNPPQLIIEYTTP